MGSCHSRLHRCWNVCLISSSFLISQSIYHPREKIRSRPESSCLKKHWFASLIFSDLALKETNVEHIDENFLIDPNKSALIRIQDLGDGTYGYVYSATLSVAGASISTVAAKELKNYGNHQELYKKEFKFLTTFQHEGICKCIGGWFTTNKEKNIKPTIILELLPHKFADVVRGAKLKGPDGGDIFITMHDVNQICIRLAEVLAWLGSSGNTMGVPVYHKDLKPDNIMLTTELQPKLIDLGLSQKQTNVEMTKELGSSDAEGTHGYIVCLAPSFLFHSLRHLRFIPRAHTETQTCLHLAWCCTSCCRGRISISDSKACRKRSASRLSSKLSKRVCGLTLIWFLSSIGM
jgi:hypothetical protein